MEHGLKTLVLRLNLLLLIFLLPSLVGAKTLKVDAITASVVDGDFIINANGTGSMGINSRVTFSESAATQELIIREWVDATTQDIYRIGTVDQTGSILSTIFQSGSGDAVNGESGFSRFYSGDVTGTAKSGTVKLSSGIASGNKSGSTQVRTGDTFGSFSSGVLSIRTGPTESAKSGTINIETGDSTLGATGNLKLSSGDAATTTGDVTLFSGIPGSGSRSGDVDILTSNTDVQSGEVFIRSGTGSTSGQVTLRTGAADNSGLTKVSTGNSDVNSGIVQILTGNSGNDSGDIVIKTGDSDNDSGDILISAGTYGVTQGSVLFPDLSPSLPLKLGASSNLIAGSIDLTTEITGILPVANGGTNGATATAGFDNLSPTTTKGDIVVSDGINNIRIAIGTDTHVLTADSAEASGLKWAAAAGGGGGADLGAVTQDILPATTELYDLGAALFEWVEIHVATVYADALDIASDSIFRGLISQTGTGESTIFGEGAGVADDFTSNKNTLYGFDAGAALDVGYENTLFGHSAFKSSAGGYRNLIGGAYAFDAATSANARENVVLGADASGKSISGAFSVIIGVMAARDASGGGSSTIIGHTAMASTTTGIYNLAAGFNAGKGASGGAQSYNILLGAFAADNIAANADRNIVICAECDLVTAGGDYQLNIGNYLHGDILNGYFGINKTAPVVALDVDGAANITGEMVLETTLIMTEIATPPTPSAGTNGLYFKSDDNLYKINSAGTEVQIDAASSSDNVKTEGATNPVYYSFKLVYSAGTPTIVNEIGTFVDTLDDDGVGDGNINFTPGAFTSTPNCGCSMKTAGSTGQCIVGAVTESSTDLDFFIYGASAGSPVDFDITVFCHGI